MRTMKVWILAFAVAVGACDKGGGGTGKERGPCYGNDTCDQGLTCLSGLCVRPPGADCTKVGEKLASYRLGNYAAREERDKVVAELTASCTKEQLTQDEGKCILDAPSRFEVASCPRPLLDELKADKTGCQAMAENVTRLFLSETATDASMRAKAEPLAGELTAVVAESCAKDGWPDSAKKCLGIATSSRDLEGCMDGFPKELEHRIEERIEPVIEKLMDAMRGKSGDASAPAIPPATAPAPALPPPPVIDAGAPSATPPPPGTTIREACKAYIDEVETYLKCTKVPQSARDAAQQGIDAMKKSFDSQAGASPEAVAAAKQACDLASAALEDSMKTFGCP
jgi:hypothetical protein